MSATSTPNDAGSETAVTTESEDSGEPANTPREKILKTLKSQLEEKGNTGIAEEGTTIKAPTLASEAYNYDVENPEDYIVPPMSWDGYTVISDLIDQEVLGNGRHDNKYWIFPEELKEVL